MLGEMKIVFLCSGDWISIDFQQYEIIVWNLLISNKNVTCVKRMWLVLVVKEKEMTFEQQQQFLTKQVGSAGGAGSQIEVRKSKALR